VHIVVVDNEYLIKKRRVIMGKIGSRCLLIVVGVGFLWFSSLCGAADNLVLNGDFEEKGPSVGGLARPNHWQGVVGKERKLSGEWATDQVHSSKYSVKLTEPDSFWIQHRIPLVHGKSYICTVNVMAKDAGVKYRFYVEAGPKAKWWAKYSPIQEAPTSWQKRTIEFTITQPLVTETKAYVILLLKTNGPIWFDDISIKEKGAPVVEAPVEVESTIGETLVKNGDLELDADNNSIPDNWIPPKEGCGSWATDNILSGKHSIKIKNNDVSKTPWWRQNKIPLVYGKTYICTINVMAKEPGVKYRFWVEAGSKAKWWSKYSPVKEAATSWQQDSIEFTVTQPLVTKEKAYIILVIVGKGTIWFDDVSIKEKGDESAAKKKRGLVLNAGFEEDTDRNNLPDYWQAPKGCGSLATDKVCDGNYSGKLENEDPAINPHWIQKGIPIEQGKSYRLTANVVSQEFGQEFRVYMEASPQEGGWWTSPTKWQQTFTDWQKRSLEFTVTKPTVKSAYIVLQMKGKGTIWFDNVTLTPIEKKKVELPPLEIELLQPSYRNTIYATQDLKTIRLKAKINLPDFKEGTIAASLKDGEETVAKQNIPFSPGKEAILELNITNLGFGKYSLVTQLSDKSRKVVATSISPLQKVGKSSAEVRVREDNVLMVNGKPFFPLSIGCGPYRWSYRIFYELLQAGFNTISAFGALPEDKEKRDSLMELADRYSMMVMSEGLATSYLRSKKEKSVTKAKELVGKDVSMVQGYNNFLGWWLDEPVWCGISNELTGALYNKVCDLDPYHVYWINHAPRNTIEELAACNVFCDITGSDIYPVPYPQNHSDLPNKTISVVGDETDKLIKTVEGKKPVLIVLQGFGWGPDHRYSKTPEELIDFSQGRRPNWEETRFMAYNAIIHGAKGIHYYGVFEYGAHVYKSSDQALWSDIRRIVKELSRLSPILIASPAKQKISVSPGNSSVEFITKECGEELYIIAANAKDEPTTVEFKNLRGVKKIRVLFEEDREVKVTGGMFKDDFKNYEVHIYTTAKELPEPLHVLKPLVSPQAQKIFGNWEPKANWIWYPGLEKTEYIDIYLRKGFDLLKKPDKAWLIIAVDDSYWLYINGKFVEKGGGHSIAKAYKVSEFLRKGNNVIAVKAHNGITYAGVYIECGIQCGGKNVTVLSDSSWSVSTKEEAGWKTGNFKATGWKKVVELGKPPLAEPWRMPYLQLAQE